MGLGKEQPTVIDVVGAGFKPALTGMVSRCFMVYV